MTSYSQLLSIFYLFCCSIPIGYSQDKFSQLEEEILLNHTILEKVPNNQENEEYLKLNRDGIKVYIYTHKNSEIKIFKATTHINTTLDSILAVMFDNNSGAMWIDSCEKAFLITSVSFNERYHYHVFDIPFPFKNRDFIFHSILEQDPTNKSVIIKMLSVSNYCNNKQFIQCNEINKSDLVRVSKSLGAFKLEPDNKGTKITWIQDTNPGGNLPSWLVNQLVQNTPYNTFKNLSEIVTLDKYKNARLIYNSDGVAYDINIK